MNKNEIFEKLKTLELDKNKVIIISGASLVVQDVVKEAKDIDMTCSKEYYETINWPTRIGSFGVEIKYKDDFEISNNLYDEKQVIKINEYNFSTLEHCLDVKRRLNRPKDKRVITKLDLILGSNDNYRYERKLNDEGIKLIAGVDEVGRGPLVGPVVAAAVILPKNYHLKGLTDSKKLSEKKREEYFEIIKKDALSIGIGEVSPKEIDEINILEASKLAMKKALNNLSIKPEHVLIDAVKLDINIPQTSIIKGDFLSQSVAAASVIAKVTRDHMMIELDKKYPMYEFKKHKGYPTKRHVELIKKYGLLENYRFTFHPVCDLIDKEEEVDKHEITN